MQEKTIELEGRTLKIHEMSYLDFLDLSELTKRSDKSKKIFSVSGLSDEEIKSLNWKEGNLIAEEINKLNGFTDFQKALTSSSDTKKEPGQ